VFSHLEEFAMKIPLLIVGGVGLAGAMLLADQRPQFNYDQTAAQVGVSRAACQTSARGPQANPFLKWAMAEEETAPKATQKNELKPFQSGINLSAGGPESQADPVLWDNLGSLHFAITTANPEAQKFFDQGLRLNYGFNHAEALRAFRKAQKLDPECAMCYWGEALALGPNINSPMFPDAVAPAFAAMSKAKALAVKASDKERALIGALTARYSNDPKAERPPLEMAYAEAMGKVVALFPRDQDIGALYAEALMDTQPWDYWEAGGSQPKGRGGEILSTLERVLKDNPNHAGAIHYYIHVVESSTSPERALPYAQRLGQQMPGAGHIVHMPFHIFYRIGQYKEALQANKEAVAIDEAYFASGAPKSVYSQGYYPHNVHSMMASAQMAGDGKTVIEAAGKLDNVVSDEAAQTFAWLQAVKSAPYFAHAQFSSADTMLALADPGDKFPFIKAMWHYARGIALAQRGERSAAENEAQAIAKLDQTAKFDDVIAWGVPANDVLKVAFHIVQARAAQFASDQAGAVKSFEAAVEAQDKLGYMEPPYWYYSVRQSLGAAQLKAGDLDKAEQAFRSSLAKAPNNAWALYGLAEVYKQRGDKMGEDATRKLFQNAWAGDGNSLDLAKL
jgi:tetratricopeptide (TPR) repeat protein